MRYLIGMTGIIVGSIFAIAALPLHLFLHHWLMITFPWLAENRSIMGGYDATLFIWNFLMVPTEIALGLILAGLSAQYLLKK